MAKFNEKRIVDNSNGTALKVMVGQLSSNSNNIATTAQLLRVTIINKKQVLRNIKIMKIRTKKHDQQYKYVKTNKTSIKYALKQTKTTANDAVLCICG